ncbi:unnamed protein product [Euphydryas editha]|uniref:Uncharacterized protein n=1 Tax=Euphydryas editha TaxID=104508 RepID=A0AAU9V402_EUPED|nr:unnamed protein product [Euphydryas editha]
MWPVHCQFVLQIHWAISATFQRSKEEVHSLNLDPWGRPSRMVKGKLRHWTPPSTQILQPQVLNCVIETLLPTRLRIKNAAPGLDGIPGRIWVKCLKVDEI